MFTHICLCDPPVLSRYSQSRWCAGRVKFNIGVLGKLFSAIGMQLSCFWASYRKLIVWQWCRSVSDINADLVDFSVIADSRCNLASAKMWHNIFKQSLSNFSNNPECMCTLVIVDCILKEDLSAYEMTKHKTYLHFWTKQRDKPNQRGQFLVFADSEINWAFFINQNNLNLRWKHFFVFHPKFVCFSLSVFVFVFRMEVRIGERFP